MLYIIFFIIYLVFGLLYIVFLPCNIFFFKIRSKSLNGLDSFQILVRETQRSFNLLMLVHNAHCNANRAAIHVPHDKICHADRAMEP